MGGVRTVNWVAAATLVAALLLPLSQAEGSGFAVYERSAEGMGLAFAGATAGYEDGSSAYFNPAAMIFATEQTLCVGLHTIIPQADFDDQGSTMAGGIPMLPADGGDGGVVAYVPQVYYVGPCSEELAIGLSINSPFGLATEWNHNWIGRYHAVRTDMLTINIAPGIAWRPLDWLSLGASVSVMYLDAELSNAINFGTIAYSQGIPGVLPGSADGMGTLTGDDWGYGFTLGLAIVPCENARLGLTYRSEIDATLKGDATFEVPAPLQPAFAGMNMFVNTSGEAELTLPQQASLGGIYTLTEGLEVSAEVGWTGWSSFDELRVDFGSAQPDSVTEESWDDTWNVALGLSFDAADWLTLRCGVAYDETPVPDGEHRTPRIPDNDRTWLAMGCGLNPSDSIHIDIGYAHLLIDDSESAAVSSTGDTLVGEYESSVDIVSVQGVVTF